MRAGPINTLLPSPVKADELRSDRLRLHPVRDDLNAPDLRPNEDFVLVSPVTEYRQEGVYLVDLHLEGIGLIYTAERLLGAGKIRLLPKNRMYADVILTREQFEERVLAIVVAEIRVRNAQAIREAVS